MNLYCQYNESAIKWIYSSILKNNNWCVMSYHVNLNDFWHDIYLSIKYLVLYLNEKTEIKNYTNINVWMLKRSIQQFIVSHQNTIITSLVWFTILNIYQKKKHEWANVSELSMFSLKDYKSKSTVYLQLLLFNANIFCSLKI